MCPSKFPRVVTAAESEFAGVGQCPLGLAPDRVNPGLEDLSHGSVGKNPNASHVNDVLMTPVW